jgi:hypothetical protein
MVELVATRKLPADRHIGPDEKTSKITGAMASYKGGDLHLCHVAVSAHLTAILAGPKVMPVDDPPLCLEDIFHVPESLDEDTGDNVEEHQPLGIYMSDTSDAPTKMTAFLTRVASRRYDTTVADHKVTTCIFDVECKLADIGIITVTTAIAEIHTINSKLFRAGHRQMFTSTLGLMAQEGIDMMNIADSSSPRDAMVAFLQLVAIDRNLTGKNMEKWIMKVRRKLQSVGSMSVKETVSGAILLNRKLHAAGASTMHRRTLESITRRGL